MERSFEREILEGSDIPEEAVSRSYCELRIIHRLLGNTRYLIHALRSDPLPLQRILDIGCGGGGVLEDVTRALGVEGIGIDVSPPLSGGMPVVKADAVHDPLPQADVAYSTFVAHHLTELDLIRMVRNVGRSCRRFIMLDVVRCWVPPALFRLCVAPFVSAITAADGQTSIRKAYTARELSALVACALDGTKGSFRHVVGPLWLRQVVDISYALE